MVDDEGNSHGHPICSICYEDLKPISEDLQYISVCGHVFHELCLQQWFEYCSNAKKLSCPVCKQKCLAKNACRLYFQSVGNQSDQIVQPKVVQDEDPKAMRMEVRRLEVKVSSLTAVVENRKKEIEVLTDELHICNEKLKMEVGDKKEALREKSINQHLLQLKSEECGRLTSECARLQERNLALAKELAALKLVSDFNLEEDEIVKLASLGNEAKTKDTVDTLVRSLVIRNRSYKELLGKCNLLGRGEARSLEKLVKATEKMEKLKKRVKELETIVEEKENGALRDLKASKKLGERATSKRAHTSLTSLDQTEGLDNDLPCFNGISNTSKEDLIVIEEDLPRVRMAEFGYSNATKDNKDAEGVQTSASLPPGVTPDTRMENKTEEIDLTSNDFRNKDVMFNIRKESPSTGSLGKPGDVCFSGGLLGPDGSNRYLGKWCKRGNGSSAVQGSAAGSGNLISVGADGRGGRVKFLRSQIQSSMDAKENSVCAKRFKSGPRTSNSQGLHIEHFFAKINK